MTTTKGAHMVQDWRGVDEGWGRAAVDFATLSEPSNCREYVTVHHRLVVDDGDRLLDVVSRLTALHEGARMAPWSVTDAPEAFIRAQLRGIVGLRLPIATLEGKRKMSQNRPEADRQGVKHGLAASAHHGDRAVSAMIPAPDLAG